MADIGEGARGADAVDAGSEPTGRGVGSEVGFHMLSMVERSPPPRMSRTRPTPPRRRHRRTHLYRADGSSDVPRSKAPPLRPGRLRSTRLADWRSPRPSTRRRPLPILLPGRVRTTRRRNDMKGYVTQKGTAGTPSSTKASTRSPDASADVACRRLQPRRRRAARRTDWRSSQRPQRPSPGPHLRRLPHATVAPGQGVNLATGDLRQLPPQGRAPHPPDTRRIRSAAAGRATRHALRSCSGRPTAPSPRAQDRARGPPHHPRCARRRRKKGLVNRTSRSSPTHHGSGRSRRSSPRHGRPSNCRRSSPPLPATGSSQPLWVLAATGMRRSELLGLSGPTSTRHGCDQAQPRPRLRRLRTPRVTRQDRQRPPPHRTRPDDGRRAVAWQQWQRAERVAVGAQTPTQVFTDCGGRPVHPDKLSQTFDRILRRAGLPVIRLHDLRHTHATLLIEPACP